MPVDRLSDDGSARLVVLDFAHLAGLAHYLERPILYEMRDGQRRDQVDDETCRYVDHPRPRWQLRPTPMVWPDVPAKVRAFGPRAIVRSIVPGRSKQVPRHTRRLRRPQHVIVARVGAGVVVLLVTITLVTSFTASTNVPVSHVGTSAQTRLIMQLAPAGCSSLSLTVLVQGSGTFSNN